MGSLRASPSPVVLPFLYQPLMQNLFLFTLHPRAKAGGVSQGLKAKETDLTPSSL